MKTQSTYLKQKANPMLDYDVEVISLEDIRSSSCEQRSHPTAMHSPCRLTHFNNPSPYTTRDYYTNEKSMTSTSSSTLLNVFSQDDFDDDNLTFSKTAWDDDAAPFVDVMGSGYYNMSMPHAPEKAIKVLGLGNSSPVDTNTTGRKDRGGDTAGSWSKHRSTNHTNIGTNTRNVWG